MDRSRLHLIAVLLCCAVAACGNGEVSAPSASAVTAVTDVAVATVPASEANVTVTFSNEAADPSADVALLVDGAAIEGDRVGPGDSEDLQLRLEPGAHVVTLTDGVGSEELDLTVDDTPSYVGAIHWGERDSSDRVRFELWFSDEPLGTL